MAATVPWKLCNSMTATSKPLTWQSRDPDTPRQHIFDKARHQSRVPALAVANRESTEDICRWHKRISPGSQYLDMQLTLALLPFALRRHACKTRKRLETKSPKLFSQSTRSHVPLASPMLREVIEQRGRVNSTGVSVACIASRHMRLCILPRLDRQVPCHVARKSPLSCGTQLLAFLNDSSAVRIVWPFTRRITRL